MTVRASLAVAATAGAAFDLAACSPSSHDTRTDRGLALHGDSGYLLGNPIEPFPDVVSRAPVYALTDGTAWAAISDPGPGGQTAASLSAVTNAAAYLLCTRPGAAGSTQKSLYHKTDTGRSWTLVSTGVPFHGDGCQISAGNTSTVMRSQAGSRTFPSQWSIPGARR